MKTSVMNCAIGIILFVIIAASNAADEAKSNPNDSFAARSSQSSSALTPSASTVNDVGNQQKQQSLAYARSTNNGDGSSNVGALSSGFKPIITSSYPTVQHQQSYPSAAVSSSAYVKHPSPYSNSGSGSPYVSTSNVKHSSPYLRGPSSYAYQPQLTFAASQPTPVSYIHNPFQFAQIYAQQMPSAAHHYNNVHHVSPGNSFYHTASIGYPQYSNPAPQQQFQQQHYHKMPVYSQPQSFTAGNYYHAKQQLITSKPSVLETPLPTSAASSTTSSSEIQHNPNGAVSYVNFSHLPKLPVPAALIATQVAPHHQEQHQNVYYHHHQQPQQQQHAPQPFYAEYKHFHPITFAQLPTIYSAGAANYFPNHQHHHHHQNQQHYAASILQPYAHISKISAIPTTSPAHLLSVSVIPTVPQKVTANYS